MGGLINGIGNLLGLNGPNTANFNAQGATQQQANAAYGTATGALGQQQQLVNALNAQNGIGNQNQVYGQLQGVAAGTGPNPAQAMLAQSTGANVANQAALAAGQRGASGNVGLMQRNAAQQGSAAQQQAAGQAATLQAQQSLGALGQLGGLATQQATQQIGAVGNLNTAAQGEQGQLLGSLSNQNSANAGVAQTNANNAAKGAGGLLGGIGSAIGGALGLAQGGAVPEHLAAVHSIYHGARDMKGGGVVPGEPKVMRDSPRNDTVPAKLSPKEIVLPISVTQAKNAPEEAARFVARELAKHGAGRKPHEEFKEALKRAIAGRRSAA